MRSMSISSINRKLKQTQEKAHTCYVLITCNEPEADGQMKVEMTYEGDPILAAYLLENAQGMIDDQINSKC